VGKVKTAREFFVEYVPGIEAYKYVLVWGEAAFGHIIIYDHLLFLSYEQTDGLLQGMLGGKVSLWSSSDLRLHRTLFW
jgi:hypothetical protein